MEKVPGVQGDETMLRFLPVQVFRREGHLQNLLRPSSHGEQTEEEDQGKTTQDRNEQRFRSVKDPTQRGFFHEQEEAF